MQFNTFIFPDNKIIDLPITIISRKKGMTEKKSMISEAEKV